MTAGNPMPAHIRFAALAVDAVCLRMGPTGLEALLGKVVSERNAFRGQWAHIGGLVRVDETAEAAVARLLRDKAGISRIYTEQLHTFSAIDRDPRGRVVSVAYLALTAGDVQDGKTGVETKWVPLSSLPKLAYDHDEMTGFALAYLRERIGHSDIARHLLPSAFTLSELQRLHELVLGQGIDKRNFRKRVLALDLLIDTKRKKKEGVMRPAALYAFRRA